MSVKNIAIVGLGLIGGSLGLAIKSQCRPDVVVTGIDINSEALRCAIERGAIDKGCQDPVEGVLTADLVFVCTPVLQVAPLVEKIIAHLKPGAILTDVGSTKGYLKEKLLSIIPKGIHYVAGHPMAGGEQSGIASADKDLFRGKVYIIVPETSDCSEAVRKTCEVVEWTGAKITTMRIEEHDHYAAVISHVPHVAAAALVALVDRNPNPEASLKLAGGGFRDTTRIASSNADMWADICLTNAHEIHSSLENLKDIIVEVMEAIEQGDRVRIHEFFRTAKLRRDSLISASLPPSAC